MNRHILISIVICVGSVVFADSPATKRVPIPSWDDVPKDIFFEDAFVEALAGRRPQSLSGKLADKQAEKRPPIEPFNGPAPAGGSEWAKLISAASIEDEFKAIKIELDRIVTTPSKFRGGGYQDARLQFTTVTMLFGVVAEYGAETKWQSYAGGARDIFARAAANSKVGDIRAYNEAKQRKNDLHDIVSGARISPPPANPDATWDQLVNRSPLMERLELAHQDRLTVWTASRSEFEANAARIIRESELVAAIGHVLRQDGMEDAGDETYDGYVDAMKQAAAALSEAVKKKDATTARSAAATIGQACSQCHEDYRG